MDVYLDDGVIALRPVSIGDAVPYALFQDAEMWDRFEWGGPATQEQIGAAMTRWVQAWECGAGERNFAVLLSDTSEVVGDGEVELRADGLVNVMYVIFVPWRGNGYAKRVARLLVGYAAGAFPGSQLVFRIHPDNVASSAVARAAGAAVVGQEKSKTGRSLDRWIIDPRTDP